MTTTTAHLPRRPHRHYPYVDRRPGDLRRLLRHHPARGGSLRGAGRRREASLSG